MSSLPFEKFVLAASCVSASTFPSSEIHIPKESKGDFTSFISFSDIGMVSVSFKSSFLDYENEDSWDVDVLIGSLCTRFSLLGFQNGFWNPKEMCFPMPWLLGFHGWLFSVQDSLVLTVAIGFPSLGGFPVALVPQFSAAPLVPVVAPSVPGLGYFP
ncbi:hypothetical protein MA16_Dca008640 [Dendrobium catenatum]|uniref:Uncharacterized protein n=1 Tax=Dendrobium catenatum TaxID=906689 RepID=A0A2I0W4D3_9ASPA|nr:hypothetical protein MA16_Dca008640 [Dendrobium catenatum]